MKTFSLILLSTTSFLLAGLFNFAAAQLPHETRQVFEEIVDELDQDLQKLFREAIKRDSATIEFTPEQFKRFRSHPANPFEGLDSVDADALENNIALKFELPTVRNRDSGKLERQHPDNLKNFAPALSPWKQSIATVFAGDKAIAMGTIISPDGLILTKSSEVQSKSKLFCQLANGTRYQASIKETDRNNDVAILKISANNLKPIRFSGQSPRPGAFLVTGNRMGKPIAIGVCSTEPRALLSTNPAYLGVRPIDSENGVKVETVTGFGAAEKAGIRVGDILLEFDDKKLTSVTQLVNYIRQRAPGDKIVIRYSRKGETKETVAELKGRTRSSGSSKSATQFGAILSERSSGFPLVFQHDTPLLPEHCGGPIVDIDGRIVGINIARHGRVGSYALPSPHVKKIVDRLLRRDVASKPKSNVDK